LALVGKGNTTNWRYPTTVAVSPLSITLGGVIAYHTTYTYRLENFVYVWFIEATPE